VSRATEFHALYRELRIADQRRFYESRRDEYLAAHRQAIGVRNTLLALAALSGFVGQFTGDQARAGCAVAATVLAAFAGVVTAYEALIGFAQLGKLFGDAATSLADAEDEWLATGPDGDLPAAAEEVERIFFREHGQWGQLIIQGIRSASLPADMPAPD
jgi:hypothetical protein